MTETSVPTVLRERASMQPNDTAYTFVDYDKDWNGAVETLTWAQLYRRVRNLANELGRLVSVGDRAVILAPQGFEYIVAFLASLHAGIVAVPLAVPQGGVSDERVSSVMADAAPSVVLTTSSVVGLIGDYVKAGADGPAPSVVEIDKVDLEAQPGPGPSEDDVPEIAYLQYTSGSTRTPAGVVMSHKNIMTNYQQWAFDFFSVHGRIPPPGTTIVSWLPFYHDMGLYLGICAPVLLGVPAVLTSPMAFLQRPARWMQLAASNSRTYTAAPNFAFELAVRKTSAEDMAGLDLSDVQTIATGSERVNPAALQRFTQHFAQFNLPDTAIRPSYGLAEAAVYVATRAAVEPPVIVRFDADKLSAGTAERAEGRSGTPLVSYGMPQSPTVRIVDPETRHECPEGVVGEIWVHGDNVAQGYWQKPDETAATFGSEIVGSSPDTPDGTWLRTGDSGFVFGGELFVVARIKDLLIVYGRNHSPDDLEATIQEVTHGRCVAIAVPDSQTEKLVVIAEVRDRGESQEAAEKLAVVKREVTSAISNSHGLAIADLVLVPPGSIPITTSGKVRRSACVEQYRGRRFARLDA
ncbi:AMP-binding protein [Mycolicibacterium confluentis]|uniref:Long-chain-fatty-acid--AMP ligase FadD28 n=1 Tax=Mycolicibacterium confluentis TaxID=28047 RepID=A0A7I7Y3K1_9MYCO|nr:AMP-binding protein [Mycolicibacterium confluentis]MCV7318379.1 AMP-binding protein [Mycolicibacterium confluentis]ORV29678.1 acyl-CoA synthetase [Mycolicibacterium confluentis]BBZ36290.1 long-chain-fatty-acid--AMP ligase FadD28 [Mycolicibacterium confluentis]